MSSLINVFVVEKQNLLREKIAGILSREEKIVMVTQMSTYPELQKAIKESGPDLVLGDYFEFNKFCKETGISSKKLCASDKLLLYCDESVGITRIIDGHIGAQRVFDIRFIQDEVKRFLEHAIIEKRKIIGKHAIKKEVKSRE